MKTWKQFAFVAIVAILAFTLAFTGCHGGDDNGNTTETSQPRETTISLSFNITITMPNTNDQINTGNPVTAIVQGIRLTEAQWNGRAEQIKTAINKAYDDSRNLPDEIQGARIRGRIISVFNNRSDYNRSYYGSPLFSVKIIVENASTYYEGIKTPNSETMILHIKYLLSNPTDIQQKIINAVTDMADRYDKIGYNKDLNFSPSEEITSDDYTCITSNTTNTTALVITKYTGSGGNITIPQNIDGIPVVGIHGKRDQTGGFVGVGLTSISIPNSVFYIGEWAFYNNQLTSVTIPNNVIGVGDGAFLDNQISSVTFGTSLEIIGDQSFENNQLAIVTIPNNVISVGEGAFRGNQISSVNFGTSLKIKIIGDHSFENNKLTSVNIPNSVTTIGENAFSNNLLTSVVISNNVTTIEKKAFSNNLLASVTIPNNVISVGEGAFLDNQISSVTFGTSLKIIGDHSFENNQLASVIIPDSVTIIGYGAFSNNQLTSVTIGKNVSFRNRNQTDESPPDAFGENFKTAYNKNGMKAGTYTRTDITSTEWDVD